MTAVMPSLRFSHQDSSLMIPAPSLLVTSHSLSVAAYRLLLYHTYSPTSELFLQATCQGMTGQWFPHSLQETFSSPKPSVTIMLNQASLLSCPLISPVASPLRHLKPNIAKIELDILTYKSASPPIYSPHKVVFPLPSHPRNLDVSHTLVSFNYHIQTTSDLSRLFPKSIKKSIHPLPCPGLTPPLSLSRPAATDCPRTHWCLD